MIFSVFAVACFSALPPIEVLFRLFHSRRLEDQIRVFKVKEQKNFKFLMTKTQGLEQIEDDIKLYEEYLEKDSAKDWERKGAWKSGVDVARNIVHSQGQ